MVSLIINILAGENTLKYKVNKNAKSVHQCTECREYSPSKGLKSSLGQNKFARVDLRRGSEVNSFTVVSGKRNY